MILKSCNVRLFVFERVIYQLHILFIQVHKGPHIRSKLTSEKSGLALTSSQENGIQ